MFRADELVIIANVEVAVVFMTNGAIAKVTGGIVLVAGSGVRVFTVCVELPRIVMHQFPPSIHSLRGRDQAEQFYAIAPIRAALKVLCSGMLLAGVILYGRYSPRDKLRLFRGDLLTNYDACKFLIRVLTPKGRFTAQQTTSQFLCDYRLSTLASRRQHVS